MSFARVALCAPVIFSITAACARMETAHFQPRPGQDSLVRDGQPAIVSRQKNSIVLVRPANRQFQAGRRPVYVIAIYNLTNMPLQFSVESVSVVQLAGGEYRSLRVYTYEELVAEEHRRQTVQAIATGLAAAGNSMSAANAGYYNGTATVYGPGGVGTVHVSGYDPVAAQIAQSRAAAQNDAMIANVVESGQRNLAVLEGSVIKDNTLLPGEWYGGQVQFDPPAGSGVKDYTISLVVGPDRHEIQVQQSPAGS
jgi:hypothetical protein